MSAETATGSVQDAAEAVGEQQHEELTPNSSVVKLFMLAGCVILANVGVCLFASMM